MCWCPEGDLNPQSQRSCVLSAVRIPISPPGRNRMSFCFSKPVLKISRLLKNILGARGGIRTHDSTDLQSVPLSLSGTHALNRLLFAFHSQK